MCYQSNTISISQHALNILLLLTGLILSALFFTELWFWSITQFENDFVQKVPTVTAQTLLIKTPDEFSAQVTPCQLGVTVGLKVMACHHVLSVGLRQVNADVVADQTDDVEVTGLTDGRCCSGRRCSQLNWIIHAEVLQLNQLTLGHPVLCRHTEMSGESFQSINSMVWNTFIQSWVRGKRNTPRFWWKLLFGTSGPFIKPNQKGRKESEIVNSVYIYSKKWCPMFYLSGANGEKKINICNLMLGFTWL